MSPLNRPEGAGFEREMPADVGNWNIGVVERRTCVRVLASFAVDAAFDVQVVRIFDEIRAGLRSTRFLSQSMRRGARRVLPPDSRCVRNPYFGPLPTSS